MIEAFRILYSPVTSFITPQCTETRRGKQDKQRLSCISRLMRMVSLWEKEDRPVYFEVIYARPRKAVAEPGEGLPLEPIIDSMGMAMHKESRPGYGYVLLSDSSGVVNVTPFCCWGDATSSALGKLLKTIGKASIKYVFVRWPEHTLEVCRYAICFVFPVPDLPLDTRNEQEILKSLMNTREVGQYLSLLWPDMEDLIRESMDDISLYFTFVR